MGDALGHVARGAWWARLVGTRRHRSAPLHPHTLGPPSHRPARRPTRALQVLAGWDADATGPTLDDFAARARFAAEVLAGRSGDAGGAAVQQHANGAGGTADVLAGGGDASTVGSVAQGGDSRDLSGSFGKRSGESPGRSEEEGLAGMAAGCALRHGAGCAFGTEDVPAGRLPWGHHHLDTLRPPVKHLAHGAHLTLDVSAGGAALDALGPTVYDLACCPFLALDVTAGGLSMDALGLPV